MLTLSGARTSGGRLTTVVQQNSYGQKPYLPSNMAAQYPVGADCCVKFKTPFPVGAVLYYWGALPGPRVTAERRGFGPKPFRNAGIATVGRDGWVTCVCYSPRPYTMSASGHLCGRHLYVRKASRSRGWTSMLYAVSAVPGQSRSRDVTRVPRHNPRISSAWSKGEERVVPIEKDDLAIGDARDLRAWAAEGFVNLHLLVTSS